MIIYSTRLIFLVCTGGLRDNQFEHLTLGNLAEKEAKIFLCGEGNGGWPGLLQLKRSSAVQLGFSCPDYAWETMHSLCGGNIQAMRMVSGWAATMYEIMFTREMDKEDAVKKSWEAGVCMSRK